MTDINIESRFWESTRDLLKGLKKILGLTCFLWTLLLSLQGTTDFTGLLRKSQTDFQGRTGHRHLYEMRKQKQNNEFMNFKFMYDCRLTIVIVVECFNGGKSPTFNIKYTASVKTDLLIVVLFNLHY